MGRERVAAVLVLCLVGLAWGAAVASAGQPVTVDFEATGTATFNAEMSPGTCNGATVFATETEVIPFSWHAQFLTTINNDGTIVDEPGYLLDASFMQAASAVGSGGDGGPGCAPAVAQITTSCDQDIPVDTSSPPELSDPDRAAGRPPEQPEDVDIQGPPFLTFLPPSGALNFACGFAANDISMLDASLPAMFTAEIHLPSDPFWDSTTGQTVDSWSADVSMPAGSPVDGSACAAGDSGVAYISCDKDVDWSGTVTITQREDDCNDGATSPPTGDGCPPAAPVVPPVTVPAASAPSGNPVSGGATPQPEISAITGPLGSADTTGGAAGSGQIPVVVTVSGPGAVSGVITAPAGPTSARAHALAKRLVIARGRAVAHHAGRVPLTLRLTRAGRTLLRTWRKGSLNAQLSLTLTSAGGHTQEVTRTVRLRAARR